MSLRAALLGLLTDAPASGYDLAGRFAAGVGSHAWSASHSQIYPELARMASDGVVEIDSIGARGKKVYRITDEGRNELRAWLIAPPNDRGASRNEFALRMYLLTTLEHAEAVAILQNVREFTANQIAKLQEEIDGYPDPTAGPVLAATYGVYSYRATRHWADWALVQLATRNATVETQSAQPIGS